MPALFDFLDGHCSHLPFETRWTEPLTCTLKIKKEEKSVQHANSIARRRLTHSTPHLKDRIVPTLAAISRRRSATSVSWIALSKYCLASADSRTIDPQTRPTTRAAAGTSFGPTITAPKPTINTSSHGVKP